MFRKPKRSAKAALRNKKQDDEDEKDEADNAKDEEEEDTSQLLDEARKLSKKPKLSTEATDTANSKTVLHSFQASKTAPISEKDLATSTAQHHPEKPSAPEEAGKGEDGIFRDRTRNKFLAGPLKAASFVRTTARFDYQPDICKDYKDTGFCGFGDTCIYLHDRGDSLTGWQLEQQYEEQKKKEREQRELDAFAGTAQNGSDQQHSLPEDGLPFACHLCREPFTDPVVTSCGHYFCEQCIMNHVRNDDKGACPICGKDTHGVFNQPSKLISKKRRLGLATWQEFAIAARGGKSEEDDGN